MLHGKRNADDGDRKGKTSGHVGQECGDAAKNEPQDIHDQPKDTVACAGRIVDDTSPKRQQTEVGELETLQAKGNPHHSEAKDNPANGVLKCDEKAAAKRGPKNIKQQLHSAMISSCHQGAMPDVVCITGWLGELRFWKVIFVEAKAAETKKRT